MIHCGNWINNDIVINVVVIVGTQQTVRWLFRGSRRPRPPPDGHGLRHKREKMGTREVTTRIKNRVVSFPSPIALLDPLTVANYGRGRWHGVDDRLCCHASLFGSFDHACDDLRRFVRLNKNEGFYPLR